MHQLLVALSFAVTCVVARETSWGTLDVDVANALFGPDADHFFDEVFERTWQIQRDEQSVTALLEGFSLNDFAHIMETTITRDMIEDFRNAATAPTVDELEMVRGIIRMPFDVEVVPAGGKANPATRKALAEEIDLLSRRTKARKQLISPREWIQLASKHGFSIIVRDADGRHPTLGRLAERLRMALGVEVGISLYYTPAMLRGVEAHIDDMDVIAVQVHGSKVWRLQESTLMLPSAPVRKLVRSKHVDDEKFPPTDVTVSQGQSLYVPRGMIHNCTAGPTASLHVSVGLESLPLKTVGALVVHLMKGLIPRHRALPAVDERCFSTQTGPIMAVRVATSEVRTLRRAVLLPADVAASQCGSSTGGFEPWVRTLRALVEEANHHIVARLTAPSNVMELASSIVGEDVLMAELDAWFSNEACPSKASQIAATAGSAAVRTATATIEVIVNRLKLFEAAVQSLQDAALCEAALRFHETATRAELDKRSAQRRWEEANYLVIRSFPLVDPLVVAGGQRAAPKDEL
jgi:hypothetical protein